MKKNHTYLIIIFLIFASCAAFSPIAGSDFINVDDDMYIIENNFIKSGFSSASIQWAFTNRDTTMWQPVTWISFMLDWRIFGNNPSGYHVVNLFLHIGAVIFLFLFLFRTTNNLWSSAFAAVFFALHPLRVESVSWATERKDVLSMFFGMACLYVYSFYVKNLKLSYYFTCLILFALALMTKSMLITLPFILLLLDYWPLRRFLTPSTNNGFKTTNNLLREKVPFFILCIASGIITIWAQYESNMPHYLTFPLRVINAIVSYASYLKKTFWAFDLAVYYPFVYSFPLWQVLGSAFILIGITVFVVYHFKKMPFLPVGWFWYLGTLVPVSGLIPVGTPMADHYTYLPSVGIAIMIAWGIPFLIKSDIVRKKIVLPAGITIIAILAVLTWQQCGYWKNSITLLSHALQITKDNFLAHNNLGLALYDEGELSEAMVHYNKAILIKTDCIEAYLNRGNVYVKLNQYQRAIDEYNKAIYLKHDYVEAYSNRGIAYAKLGHYQRAIDDFSKAIYLKPNFAKAYKNRGIIYIIQGNNNWGCSDVQKACTLGKCKILEMAKNQGACR
ncbi:MAG: tetratricopeptide repeat protein [Syntrophaceae bacterium]|nr:tetratricopeptide repeat protein [Syntrophaceae bacterium]